VSFTSYAQNFEDVLLWRALNDIDGGKYLDVGAQDPVIDSVSLAFYEAGWRGMHVEPVPQYANRLREMRNDEPVIEAAVTDAPGPMLFHELWGLSTGRKDIADHHASMGHDSRQMLVPTVRLEQCMTVLGRDIHWLKIDVEGMEGDVLRSWGDCDIRPWILLIEATYPNSRERTDAQWLGEVMRRGYEMAFFDGLSSYFVHEDHRERSERFGGPANVFDDFVITRNHYAARLIGGELEGAEARADRLSSELDSARAALRSSSEQERGLSERLVAAERVNAELADDLGHALRAAAAREVELAQLSERSSQLQNSVSRADVAQAKSEARAEELQAELAVVREALQQERLSGARQNARLASTSALAMAMAADPGGLWQRIMEAVGLARPRSTVQAFANLLNSLDGPQGLQDQADFKGSDRMQSLAAVQDRNPYLRANSLEELLSWDDLAFVRCAYVTVLGRQPDAAGESYYVNRIRRGYSKMEVLWQLRKSPEGPHHDPGIAGLDRALRRARLARAPLMGGLFRLFNQEEGDSASDRRQRAMANDIAVLRGSQHVQVQGMRDLTAIMQRVESRMGGIGDERALQSFVQRSLLDPVDLSSAKSPEDVISVVKASINQSREVAAFRSESRASS